jgi:hypothetical protein
VLLGQGSPAEKARLLFETYDGLSRQSVRCDRVSFLALYSVAVEKLAILAGADETSAETSSAKLYLAKIKHVKGAGIEKLL